MQQHQLTPGSSDWLAHRAKCWNASDAPAMMGASPYKSRNQLIKEVATGLTAEVDAGTQRLFDAGHRFEALARQNAEAIVGDDLSPLCGSIDAGLSRPLAASFDGLTFMNDVAWEHKTLNDSLRASIRQKGGNANDFLAPGYRIQMEQQLMVSGARRCLFTATRWDGDTLVEERACWYRADPELRAQILAGWEQLEKDVAAYQPGEVAPAVVAEPVQALPAVLVQVSGNIAITANFGAFETSLRDFLEHRLIREPKTDQDFADLDLQIKAMKGAEAALDAAEGQMLAQIASVDTAKKTKDMLTNLVRTNRLMAEKLLASEKERRKAEIVAAGVAALREHCDAVQKRAGVSFSVHYDFAGVIKGKKSLTSMEDAIGTELARGKIEANRIADLIDANRKAMDAAAAAALFPDFSSVCTKPADDFANLIVSRNAQVAARMEAERERIRKEEVARLEREAAAKRAEEERQQRAAADAKAREEAAAQAQRDAEARAAAQAEAQRQADALAAEKPAEPAPVLITAFVEESVQITTTPAAAPAPEVRTFRRVGAPVEQAEPYTVRLGEIQALIAPYTITAEGIVKEGFQFRVERGMKFYRQSDARELFLKASRHFAAKAEELLQADPA